MTDLLHELKWRGMLQDATPGLAERLARGPITGYIGFDPTADSLHVGNLVPVMGLAWLQRSGGTPIALVGGGTGMVGDPSGKRNERPMLAVEQIDANGERIRNQLAHFLAFQGSNAARMRNNADWLRHLGLMEFLRDAGKHFTLSYMLQKESVRSRLETGISFTEFSYMLVQAYDFWHLFETEGCELQMGGSDQWGNITAGCELVARREGQQVHGLVFPLLTTATGGKFGKSEAGNVWLDPVKTPDHQFYQYWFNTDDRDLERFLKCFTFLPAEEIADLMRVQAADPGKRTAHERLADEVTRLARGEEAVQRARQARESLFPGETGGTSRRLAEGVPKHFISESEVGEGIAYVDAFVRVGLASSKSDARRSIQGKGYYVNGKAVDDVEGRLQLAELEEDQDGPRYWVLRKGKKNHVALIVTPDR
jgi:tyrosyl-tRNA synthetase